MAYKAHSIKEIKSTVFSGITTGRGNYVTNFNFNEIQIIGAQCQDAVVTPYLQSPSTGGKVALHFVSPTDNNPLANWSFSVRLFYLEL